MAKQKTYDELDHGGLIDALADAKQELFNLRFQHATGQLENNARIGLTRREVARLNTELRSREIAAAEALAQEKK
jgi:large subunit ribosomal protein L29